MTRLAVLADDLTGALDASAPFAARGLATAVALSVEGLAAALATGADIVGVSTDSREIAPEAAQQAVADCVAHLPDGQPIFKKIDSRLKGNIAAELDAIPHDRALVIPAIPAFGRWVRDGMLGGFGVADPIDIAGRLGRHASLAAIPDATSQSEIERAVATIPHDLPIGARGLAEAIANGMAADVPIAKPAIAGPVICVIGSTDPITLEQIDRLRAGYPALAYLAAPDGQWIGTDARSTLTVLQVVPGNTGADASLVAARLGQALLGLQPPPGTTLLISGGATAQIVLRILGITVLDLVGEVLPGLPIARAGGFTIITKSGGFGQSGVLLDLLGHLAGPQQESVA